MTRPEPLRVLRTRYRTAGPSNWHHVRGGAVRQWGSLHARQGRALDSRHVGPRSAYGQALREALALAESLNAEVSKSCEKGGAK